MYIKTSIEMSIEMSIQVSIASRRAGDVMTRRNEVDDSEHYRTE